MGVTYRILDTHNISRYMGVGVSYGSPSLSENFHHKTISIVGGANSAGQAAVYLADCKDCEVNLIVRADSIEKGMSDYLVHKVRARKNIHVYTDAEVVDAKGQLHLESFDVQTSEGIVNVKTDRAFVLIGAKPKTHWLEGIVPLDERGFVLTDKDLQVVPGIYAAGDIRAESVKRVGSALGEGARSVNGVRSHLNWLKEQENLIEA
ncbi:putative FAD/NAD(P)-binding domain, FAD/NAD(P)-binding domain superfamily [Arabidopsis thaliana]